MPDYLILPIIVGCFIMLDIISGVTQAVCNKELSSEKLRKGAFHKFSFVIIICLAYLIDYGVGVIDLGFNFPIVWPTCVYICLTEIVSITENIILINPELKGSRLIKLFKSSELEEKKDGDSE